MAVRRYCLAAKSVRPWSEWIAALCLPTFASVSRAASRAGLRSRNRARIANFRHWSRAARSSSARCRRHCYRSRAPCHRIHSHAGRASVGRREGATCIEQGAVDEQWVAIDTRSADLPFAEPKTVRHGGTQFAVIRSDNSKIVRCGDCRDRPTSYI